MVEQEIRPAPSALKSSVTLDSMKLKGEKGPGQEPHLMQVGLQMADKRSHWCDHHVVQLIRAATSVAYEKN